MMRKWVFVIILLVLGFIGYNYLYRAHRNIEKEQPSYVVSVRLIIKEFLDNPSASESKYLNKTIEINGIVTENGDSYITLDNSVFCQFNTLTALNLKLGDSLNVKGRCIGYDSLLEQIKLDQCTIVISEE